MSVYLIHFTRPLHHARHYLGSSKNAYRRFDQHCLGRGGAKIVDAALAVGIGLRLARVWPGGRQEERKAQEAQRIAGVVSTL